MSSLGSPASASYLTLDRFTSAIGLRPLYLPSPEQFAGVGVDIRSDLYSLGVVLWKMVTGHVVFRGSPAELMYQHQHVASFLWRRTGVGKREARSMCLLMRWSHLDRAALQECQGLLVELLDLLIEGRMRAIFKDRQFGAAYGTCHPVCKTSRRQQVAPPKGDLRGVLI